MEELFALFKEACVKFYPGAYVDNLVCEEQTIGYKKDVDTYFTTLTYAQIFVGSYIHLNLRYPQDILVYINHDDFALGWFFHGDSKEQAKVILREFIALHD